MNDQARTDDSDDSDVSPEGESHIVVASAVYPSKLPIIPLPSRPMFPKTVAPLLILSPPQLELIQEAVQSQERLVGLVLRRHEEDEPAAPGDEPQPALDDEVELHDVGVVAQILKTQQTGPQLQVLAGGLDRFRIKRILSRKPRLLADVEYLYEPKVTVDQELRAYALAVINTVKELIQLNPLFKQELNLLVQQGSIEEPGRLADYAAYLTSAKGEELQRVLEMLDVRMRLEKVMELLRREIDISKLQEGIRKRIEERISKQQREFFLREQLKAIKKELGLEKDDKEEQIAQFLERLEGKDVPIEAQERIDEEVEKLRTLEPSSPELTVTRNYLDWLTVLPWGVTTEADISLASARIALEESHHGLEDVKERILEHIAGGILKGSFAGSIVLLVGPPGVGKTSIGRSIAKALGREFYRFSLGGMQDEAEIKGHRRTYIGAMPGKFVQAMRICKASDPVIMLDEIDKIGASYRGDPASALLEALDPEQNVEFLDHYLDVRFDLSNVTFICTANQLDTIPGPLLDRMEIIKLSGYLLEEKLAIARQYIVPRQLEAHGLSTAQLTITKPALRAIVEGYARDPGVRTVEKQIKKIVRKGAVKLLEHQAERIVVAPDDLRDLLGRAPFRDDSVYAKPRPGVVLGLAWTSMGGDTLFIEATAIPQERAGFKQTGQLGKVMLESSEIAYTHARRLVARRAKARGFFDENEIHLHVPAGATPKDGPSAGITMCAALYTLATDKAIKKGFAMTGELNLSGQVLAVGGIKEKVIAARRAKVKHVILPKENEGDWEDLPDHLKAKLRAHFVTDFDEVLELCLDG